MYIDKSAWGHQEGNPTNEDEIVISELEESKQEAWTTKNKLWRLQEKVLKASNILDLLIDKYSTSDNTFVLEKLKEIKAELE
jgi:hypothetical protein